MPPPGAAGDLNYHLLDMNGRNGHVRHRLSASSIRPQQLYTPRAATSRRWSTTGRERLSWCCGPWPAAGAVVRHPALDEHTSHSHRAAGWLLNSDGVTDAINRREEPFGVARLQDLVASCLELLHRASAAPCSTPSRSMKTRRRSSTILRWSSSTRPGSAAGAKCEPGHSEAVM